MVILSGIVKTEAAFLIWAKIHANVNAKWEYSVQMYEADLRAS